MRLAPLPLGIEPGEQLYRLSLSDQPNCLVAVAGSSGTGKTEFLRSLASHLHHQDLPVVLFDLHGDLKIRGPATVSLDSGTGFDPVRVLRQLPDAARRAVFRQILPTIGYVQEAQLSELLSKAQTLPQLLQSLSVLAGASSAGLRAAIEQTFADPVFRASGFDAAALGNKSLRIDLSKLSRPAQPVAASLALLLLFERLRSAGPTARAGQLRTFVFLDEASILRSEHIVDVLSREARKFGLGLAVASQSVRDLSADVLGNAAVTVCFRLLTKPEARLVEAAVPGMRADVITALKVPGEALIRDSNGVHQVRVTRASTREKK